MTPKSLNNPRKGFTERDCEVCRQGPWSTRVNHLCLCVYCYEELTSKDIKHHFNIYDGITDEDDAT